MEHHIVLGSGPVGSGVALALAGTGARVSVLTRSGTAPRHDGVRALALDVGDAEALRRASRGAASIVNCVSPPYHRWRQDWPPLAAAVLAAAQDSGAVLVTASNLYGYGPVDGAMTEDTPLASAPGTKGAVRARTWTDALAAHRAGRVRATEARASDYFGAGSGRGSQLDSSVLAPAARGRTVRPAGGDPDTPHSWTYLPDVVDALVVLATDERAWGRAWHVPTAPARSVRQVVADVADLQGSPVPRVRPLPRALLRAVGAVMPVVRELRYQVEKPFVVDSSAFETTFGAQPTPWREALRADLDGHGFPARGTAVPARSTALQD